MGDSLVLYEVRGAVAVLTLNRPDKLNALDDAVICSLHAAMDPAESEPGIRAVVLKGAGRAFSAGFDLKEAYAPPAGTVDPVRAEIERDFRIIMRFWDSPLPTIAAVHGYCLGGAFELSLACDLTVAADDTLFGAPEARIGSGIVALLLPWVCGPKRAREILLLGLDRLSAEQCKEAGIVNRVVATEDLEREALGIAAGIAGNSQPSVRLTKAAINGGYDKAGLKDALAAGLEACIRIESEREEQDST